MISLKTLLTETDLIASTELDEWDNWYDYLEDLSYEINKDVISKLIKKYNLHGKSFFDGKIAKLWDTKKEMYLRYDIENKTADVIKNIEEWIYTIDNDTCIELGIDSDTIYNPWTECNIKDLCENPGYVYHYTTDENWEEIKVDGKLIGSRGTGINNRYSHGIFASIDPETYANGTYGDICLELDLARFINYSGLTKLNLSFESDVTEYLIHTYIKDTLELENSDDVPSDISPYTIIVGHTIPMRFIKSI